MAVQLVTKINRYIGTAAEIAAMTLTGIPVGSTFFESDTGILKILNAAGALVNAPSESVALSGSSIPNDQPVPTTLVGSLPNVVIDQSTPGVTNGVSVRQIKAPSQEYATDQAISGVGKQFAEDTTTGYIYGVSGSNLIRGKSDGSGSHETIWTKDPAETYFGNEFSYRFPNGRLLTTVHVVNTEARVYVSDLADDTAKTFTKTLTASGYPYAYWGWHVYGDLVFFGEYEPIDAATYKNRYVYMSRDQGLTWETIFDRRAVGRQGLEADPMHIHDITYDPYTSMIWITCGDLSWRGVFYSYDFGGSWYSLYDESLDPTTYRQWLGVCATPEYVVLCTDSFPSKIAALKKPIPLTRIGGEFDADLLEYRFHDWTATNEYSLFHSFIHYNGAWYCASTNTTTDFYPSILGSPNGYDWYELYRHKKVATATNAGFLRFYRGGNYLVGYLKDDSSAKYIKLPVPTWSAI